MHPRTVAGSTLIVALLATSFAAPAQAARPEPRASAAPTAVDLWADFQTPAPWMDQDDNLHWYVQSPIITKKMANRTATTTITTPATLDCTELGSGYVRGDVWTNVDLTVKSCNQTEAVVTYTVTPSMIGTRVFVNGWAATNSNPATVAGTVAIGKTTASAEVTASKTDKPVPVAPGTLLGTWNGKDVKLASEAGANQIWFGSQPTDAPAGNIVNSSLTDGVVTLWVQNEASMDQWKLDLSTGTVTTNSIAGTLVSMGKPAFAINTGKPVTYGTETLVVRWDGTTMDTVGSYGSIVSGYTDTAVVTEGGYRVSWINVTDADGTVWGGASGPAPGVYLRITLIAPDRVEFTYPYTSATQGPQNCVITKGNPVACTPI